MKKIMRLIWLWLLISSCTPTPQPINYGYDLCHSCKMNIVDQQHAAELVTSKGKVYPFDAIECMVNYKLENETTDFAYVLITDFNAPKRLIDAKESYFLISKALPSPMGANLTGFANKTLAIEKQNELGGTIYNWRELQHFFVTNKYTIQ